MIVHCPHCLTGYLLPDHLVGDKGARVRCPGCDGVFVVLPESGSVAPESAKATAEAAARGASGGEVGRVAAAPGPPGPVPEARPSVDEPAAAAAAVLDELADFLGDDLTRSRLRGSVLSDHGPAIMAGWEEYRRRAGADAPSDIFRAVLRDRCGVDLSRVNGS